MKSELAHLSKAVRRFEEQMMESAMFKKHGTNLPSTCLDRFPVDEQRQILIAWKLHIIKRIEQKVADVYDNGNGQRVRNLIRALSSSNGKI